MRNRLFQQTLTEYGCPTFLVVHNLYSKEGKTISRKFQFHKYIALHCIQSILHTNVLRQPSCGLLGISKLLSGGFFQELLEWNFLVLLLLLIDVIRLCKRGTLSVFISD